MCGRDYSTYTDEELEIRYLNKRSWRWPIEQNIPDHLPNYNTCPTHRSLVLAVVNGALGFHSMRWGLVPSWAKSVKDADKYSMINAKSEEITEKRSFKEAFKKRRCIVPISGFFEWKRVGKTKRPFAIFLKDEPIMSLAGIWEQWVSKEDGEIIDSYALLTTAANSFMEKIHTRMPVILAKEEEHAWLDPDNQNADQLQADLKPCPSQWLSAYEVSTLVNSPKNNSPEILAKFTAPKN